MQVVPTADVTPLPETQALPEEAFADWYCPACEQQLNRESTWLNHQNVDPHLSAAQAKLIALTGPPHAPGPALPCSACTLTFKTALTFLLTRFACLRAVHVPWWG
jgi:hypothetical protein